MMETDPLTNYQSMTPLETYHWKGLTVASIRGNNPARSTQPEVGMMVGMKKLVKINIHEDDEWKNKTVYVLFDEDYVVYWLGVNLVTPLKSLGWQVILSLLTKAYAPYRSPGRVRASRAKQTPTKTEDDSE